MVNWPQILLEQDKLAKYLVTVWSENGTVSILEYDPTLFCTGIISASLHTAFNVYLMLQASLRSISVQIRTEHSSVFLVTNVKTALMLAVIVLAEFVLNFFALLRW